MAAAPPRMAAPHRAHERALAAHGGRLLGAASRIGCATWWPTMAAEHAQVARRWAQRAPRLARRRAAGCRTLCVAGVRPPSGDLPEDDATANFF
ncbi:hypothetical protein F511_45311 [Dorcoceras hygrometricum]|uniref:Uncharacterized protein n=1 Tax=Dorcoceras hygrometricum TaxID=472368 RepID=A0A2Z6ZWC0_9LAMI|nr:hypothetical protein F511_45311 [Dorcoceras hygrometricum]